MQQKESRDCNNIIIPERQGMIVIRPTSSSDYKLSYIYQLIRYITVHILFITGHLDDDLELHLIRMPMGNQQ